MSIEEELEIKLNTEKGFSYHFYQLSSKRAEILDDNGLRKMSFISEELNTELYVFLWVDENNEIDRFQFFFFEKVIEWSRQSGLTKNITNRLQNPETQDKTGIFKGLRTLQQVDDHSMLDEALEIVNRSVFPLGIKDILKLRMNDTT
ncbi:MAG: hypothetical protein GY866_28800 [Proteobacteria bacterium]|nr:hypothetical protein [Pseudomonadota bacterium]